MRAQSAAGGDASRVLAGGAGIGVLVGAGGGWSGVGMRAFGWWRPDRPVLSRSGTGRWPSVRSGTGLEVPVMHAVCLLAAVGGPLPLLMAYASLPARFRRGRMGCCG
jgi:hypothetical protein